MSSPISPSAASASESTVPAIGIIGGSGLYDIEGLTDREEFRVSTPFGDPSDAIVTGVLAGRRVYFLPRHGRGHRLLPTELPHRANIYALRSLGVRFIIAVTAVGSLRQEYRPRDIVLPHQFFDRLSRRDQHTFFGRGIVAHIAFADPISTGLRQLLAEAAREEGATVHDGGTYVCMDGPAFSTRAESNANRQLGFDVIGMTNLPEAKLAREAEIALATLAMVTDYDCWKIEEEPVTAETVVGHLHANAARAKNIVARVIPRIPTVANWPEHAALTGAMLTPRSFWPEETVASLGAILAPYVGVGEVESGG
ncbi:S-methyl-5'-thioadenosine phosphorylase [Verrucomicrobium sp. BvORR034]|uniref:S-methyl-5'-thioadenosine phosphorylase n=1 Tax=Verrucomicrobium sp. BvORR034 TaxID=1396418 RepID=UPI000678BE3B|nr:S-methyl-5'-thioadenosine phosphorylase [Verrucomicrobium sp. BvORR034]